MGIDPGKSGGAVVITERASMVDYVKFTEQERIIVSFFEVYGPMTKFALHEEVRSSPQQGVKSAFTFGHYYGLTKGLVLGGRIPCEFWHPKKWQKAIGLSYPVTWVTNEKTGKRKKKRMTDNQKKKHGADFAKQIFPDEYIIYANADALLIAETCRRWRRGMVAV